jgi:hypothetical protein
MEPYGDFRDVTDEDRADAFEREEFVSRLAEAMAATADFHGVRWGDDDIDSRGTVDRMDLLRALRLEGVMPVLTPEGDYRIERNDLCPTKWPQRTAVKDMVLEVVRESLRARPLPLDPLQQGPGWLDDRARNLTMALVGSFDMIPAVIK